MEDTDRDVVGGGRTREIRMTKKELSGEEVHDRASRRRISS